MRALRCITATYQWGLREHLEVNMYFDMLATKKCVLIENHMSLRPEVRKMSPFGEGKPYISKGCKTIHFQRMYLSEILL